MKINELKFGLATAISFGLVWLICSLLVWLMPSLMLGITGHMIHGDWSQMGWQLTLKGVVYGLVGWMLLAGFSGWLLAVCYNKLR
ncbi:MULTISPECIES: DUF5676 family membrane protein [Kangiella]|uniref:Uncharacterized protein n=1 Tax=Kangiella koreensis (strain DSM 16069 / JCM 12317 / KCTC 12182 / SW-125) TaxID=523791 RepID=C7RBT8_KANKD|nr:DUF5676 family membrane protein [Kangiella koreensis]ACV26730.1 conserved hypothetical protein [Kangiella koreensis DSM 16069]